MAKLLKRLLALCAAAALLFVCAACNGGKTPDPTEEVTTEEPETIGVVVTTDVDESSTEEETTTEEPTSEDETTTAEATTGAPKSKPEIIAYVNEVMNKVREEKPGYTSQERTVIDDSKLTSSNGATKGLAKTAISVSKGLWSKWSDPSTKAKGSDHNGVAPKVDLQNSWVKSASCTDNGGTYQIRINLADERVPELPTDEKSTIHGKISTAYTKGQIADGASKAGVNIQKFDGLYTGSYIDMTVDKATGLPKKINVYISVQADMVAKLLVTVDASLPLANERQYTF